jgi:hypothetical protein
MEEKTSGSDDSCVDTEVIVIDAGEGRRKSNGSLQDSFKKFMDQKKRERQIQQMCREGELSGRKDRTEEEKQVLREKFIAQAMKYLGVPYAERYKAPEAPIAPLYLDCCGLVRQAVKDLQDDFRFIIGRWNQCYQMDTLPVVLEEKDMKPGDLVFYEGEFLSKRSKTQKHNIVHVEIWLGGETGESTLGSRYFRGCVSVWPSYKFENNTWKVTKYHFRSIDTWLNGVCKSFCPEHPWNSDLLAHAAATGKRSIFYTPESREQGEDELKDAEYEDEDDDINAVPMDELPSDAAEVEAMRKAAESVKSFVEGRETCQPCSEQEDGLKKGSKSDDQKKSLSGDKTHDKDEIAGNENSLPSNRIDQAPLASGESSLEDCDEAEYGEEVQKEKKEKKEEGTSGAFGSPSVIQRKRYNSVSTSSPSKTSSAVGPSSSSKSPMRKSQSGRASVGSSSLSPAKRPSAGGKSPDASGSKRKGAGKRVGEARQSGVGGMSRSASGSFEKDTAHAVRSKPRNAIPLTYFVGKANGWQMVKESMDRRGWQQLPFDYGFSAAYGLKWVERRSAIDYRAHEPGQLACHIPNNEIICSKVGLLTAMRDTFCRASISNLISGSSREARNSVSPSKRSSIHASTSTRGVSSSPTVAGRKSVSSNRYSDAKDTASSTSSANTSVRVSRSEPSPSVRSTPEKSRTPGSMFGKISIPKTPWLPDTYLLDSPADVAACIEEEEKLEQETGRGAVWIYKPSCNNRGRGIRVFMGKDILSEICYGKDTGDTDTSTKPLKGIMQRYMENPLLVGPSKFKFDIRCYMLVARNYPTYIVFYHPGYCRLTLKSYSLDKDSFEDASIHLTNAAVQKKDPLYAEHKDKQIQTIEEVALQVEQSGNVKCADFMRNDLDHQIKKCMVDVLKASTPKLLRKHGYFDLFGFDFMVSDENELVLLEVNTNPAMSRDNHVLEELLPTVIDGTLQLVLDAQGPARPCPNDGNASAKRDADMLSDIPGQFQLIYEESKGYMYA